MNHEDVLEVGSKQNRLARCPYRVDNLDSCLSRRDEINYAFQQPAAFGRMLEFSAASLKILPVDRVSSKRRQYLARGYYLYSAVLAETCRKCRLPCA
jgi:hypothetical protein